MSLSAVAHALFEQLSAALAAILRPEMRRAPTVEVLALAMLATRTVAMYSTRGLPSLTPVHRALVELEAQARVVMHPAAISRASVTSVLISIK